MKTFKKLLEEKGVTVKQLKDESGVPLQTIKDLYNDVSKFKNARVETALNLAKALNMSIEEIYDYIYIVI